MICFWRDVRTYNFIVRYLHVARHSCEEKNYCQKFILKIKMLFIFWSVRLYVAYTSTNACNVISKCIKRYIAVFFIEVLVVMHYGCVVMQFLFNKVQATIFIHNIFFHFFTPSLSHEIPWGCWGSSQNAFMIDFFSIDTDLSVENLKLSTEKGIFD